MKPRQNVKKIVFPFPVRLFFAAFQLYWKTVGQEE